MYLIAPTRVLLEYVWFQRRLIIKLQLFDAQNIKIDICKTALFIDITSRCNSSCSFYVSGYFFPINLPCNILWIVGICGHTQPKCINRFLDWSPIILQVTFHPRVVCGEKAKNTPAVYCPQLRRMLVLVLLIKMAISPLSSSQGSVSKLNFTLG